MFTQTYRVLFEKNRRSCQAFRARFLRKEFNHVGSREKLLLEQYVSRCQLKVPVKLPSPVNVFLSYVVTVANGTTLAAEVPVSAISRTGRLYVSL